MADLLPSCCKKIPVVYVDADVDPSDFAQCISKEIDRRQLYKIKHWRTNIYHRMSVILPSCPLSLFLPSNVLHSSLSCSQLYPCKSIYEHGFVLFACLQAAVFSATSVRHEDLPVGIFSDADCFRSLSVVQS